MKMDEVAGSGVDEFYTPRYAVEPILKYVKQGSHAWCPFDTKDSFFVKMLNESGIRVTCTHLSQGQDFFSLGLPDGVDCIISNPPYSIKTEVFEKLFDIGLPFAMLVGVVGLFESRRRFQMFRDNVFEVMYLDKRVAYLKGYADKKTTMNPPFSSVYLCSKMLPSAIVFETINKTSQNEKRLFLSA